MRLGTLPHGQADRNLTFAVTKIGAQCPHLVPSQATAASSRGATAATIRDTANESNQNRPTGRHRPALSTRRETDNNYTQDKAKHTPDHGGPASGDAMPERGLGKGARRPTPEGGGEMTGPHGKSTIRTSNCAIGYPLKHDVPN